MTIDEAIKVQRRVLGKLASDNYLKADEYQSFQLGIEALEAIKAGRGGTMSEVKPPILNLLDEDWKQQAGRLYDLLEQQRDADAQFYEPKLNGQQLAIGFLTEQARLSTAREKDEYIKFMWQMIKFCPNCGAYLPQNLNGTRTHTCSNCNWSGESLKSRYGEEK